MGKREHWDGLADVWEQRTVAQLQDVDPYGIVAIDALPLDDYTSILDIGCGPGATTVELAQRAGRNTRVTGVDVSPLMIQHARQRQRLALERGEITPANISFLIADAEHDDLGAGHDVVFSRFGTMFFDDPATGFANLARALKPDGWLSMVAWAAEEANPWLTLPSRAAAPTLEVELEDQAAPGDPGPWSLADPEVTTDRLGTAGFDRINIIDVTQPRRIRHTTERPWVARSLRSGPLADAFDAADPDRQDAAIDAALGALERYREPGPVGDRVIPAHARVFVARRVA